MDVRQDRTQVENMVQDCILAHFAVHFAGQRIDAMDISRTVRERYGIRIDWHVAADVLERLERQGYVSRAGISYDGQCAYKLPA